MRRVSTTLIGALLLLIGVVLICHATPVSPDASSPEHERVVSKSHRSKTEQAEKARFDAETEKFHQRMIHAGVRPDTPIEDIVTQIREITQTYPSPNLAGRFAAPIIKAHYGGEAALKEYRRLKEINKRKITREKYDWGEGGPRGRERFREKVAGFKQFERQLIKFGMNPEHLEPEELWSRIYAEPRISKIHIADKVNALMKWKEKYHGLDPMWRIKFKSLVGMKTYSDSTMKEDPREYDEVSSDTRTAEGFSRMAMDEETSGEVRPVIGNWKSKQHRSEVTVPQRWRGTTSLVQDRSNGEIHEDQSSYNDAEQRSRRTQMESVEAGGTSSEFSRSLQSPYTLPLSYQGYDGDEVSSSPYYLAPLPSPRSSRPKIGRNQVAGLRLKAKEQ
ncbi:hypothetical protein CBS101457_002802 [Exobasidium rhododendri]|nr:hypothetical protein CBS101457_002802 [Exobasidium rhododendri]